MRLKYLKKYYAFFQRHSVAVVSMWVKLPSVAKNLDKLDITTAQFQKLYASHIYKYFLNVINGTNTIGNCPAMKEFVSLMVEKEIQSKDAFMICLGLKTVLFRIIDKGLHDDKFETLTEVYQLLDANFSGVLELFTELFLQKKQEQKLLEVQRNALLKVQTALDIQENFTLVVDDKFEVKLANRSFLDIFALKDVAQLNQKYPNLSFIEYFMIDKKELVYDAKLLQNIFDNPQEFQKTKVRLNFIPYMYKFKIQDIEHKNEYMITLNDISEYEQELQKLRKKVYIDSLTKTYNSIKYEEELKRFLSLKKELVTKVAAITICIDELNFYKFDYDVKIVEDLIVKTAKFLKQELKYVEMLSHVSQGRFSFLIYGKESYELKELVEDLMQRYRLQNFFINDKPTFSTAIVYLHKDDTVASILERTELILNDLTKRGGNIIQDDTLEYEKQLQLKSSNSEIVRRLMQLPKDAKLKAAFLYGELVVFFTLTPDKKVANGYRFLIKEDVNVLSENIYFEFTDSDITIEAKVVEFSKKNSSIILKEFTKEVESSPLKRECVHVTPKGRIRIDIQNQKYYAKGFISSLSQKQMSVYVKDIGRCKKDDKVTLQFEIYLDNSLEIIELNAVIGSINSEKDFFKLTLEYASNMDKNHPLIRFIYARQLEIIRDYNDHL